MASSDDPVDRDQALEALSALVPQLATEASRIGLHHQGAVVLDAAAEVDNAGLLVCKFTAGDLAWSDRVQAGTELLGELKDELADIELDVAIQDAEEAHERRQTGRTDSGGLEPDVE